MSKNRHHRFEDVHGRVYENEGTLEELVQEIWIDRMEEPPFQLVDSYDPQIVLRFVLELPQAWSQYVEPEWFSARAHAICCKLRQNDWRILWSAPIVSDIEIGDIYVWSVTMSRERMRWLV